MCICKRSQISSTEAMGILRADQVKGFLKWAAAASEGFCSAHGILYNRHDFNTTFMSETKENTKWND